jgi:hypothetical protein
VIQIYRKIEATTNVFPPTKDVFPPAKNDWNNKDEEFTTKTWAIIWSSIKTCLLHQKLTFI